MRFRREDWWWVDSRRAVWLMVLGFLVVAGGASITHATSFAATEGVGSCGLVPPETEPPAYYAIDLVPTRNLPGLQSVRGVGQVSFAPSPFGIAVSPQGHYVYDLKVVVEGLRPAPYGAYVVWISTPNLDQIRTLGPLDENMEVQGRVDWNKFLVIVTLEPSVEELGTMWQGPIVLRGLSRSGLMHTMAGHGPFEQEPCAKYGYY